MKLWIQLALVALLTVGLAGVVQAKKKDKGSPVDQGIVGTVVKIDGKNLVIKNVSGEQTIATDDNTLVVINGVTSKLADLKADQEVRITPSYGTPTKIEVGGAAPTPPVKEKKKKNH